MTSESTEYRSRIRIYADILRTISSNGGEARPTRILYRANLTHKRLTKYLRKLEELGLITEVKKDHRTYRLTERGIDFLREFRKVERFADAFGFAI